MKHPGVMTSSHAERRSQMHYTLVSKTALAASPALLTATTPVIDAGDACWIPRDIFDLDTTQRRPSLLSHISASGSCEKSSHIMAMHCSELTINCLRPRNTTQPRQFSWLRINGNTINHHQPAINFVYPPAVCVGSNTLARLIFNR